MVRKMSFLRKQESRLIPAELVPVQAGSVKPEIQKTLIQISLDSRFRGNDEITGMTKRSNDKLPYFWTVLHIE